MAASIYRAFFVQVCDEVTGADSPLALFVGGGEGGEGGGSVVNPALFGGKDSRLSWVRRFMRAAAPSTGAQGSGMGGQSGRKAARRVLVRDVVNLEGEARGFVAHGDMEVGAGAAEDGNDAVAVLSLYRYIGVLMGVALRGGTAMPLRLSPVVWAALVQPLTMTMDDAASLNTSAASTFTALLRATAGIGIGEEQFASFVRAMDRGGTFVPSDAVSYRGAAGAGGVAGAAGTAGRLADAVTLSSLVQSYVAVRAMREGLESIIPPLVLAILQPSELEETLAAGRY
jgi:hypothetical protein